MPHYYFHLATDKTYSLDDEGLEFADLDEAYLEACRTVLDMSFDMLRDRIDPHQHRFDIVDQAGVVLIDLPFAEVLRPHLVRSLPSTGDGLQRDVQARLKHNKVLRDDLRRQISAAQSTLAKTKKLLARSQSSVLSP